MMILVTKNRKHFFDAYVPDEKANLIYDDLKSSLGKGYSVTLENSCVTDDDINMLTAIKNLVKSGDITVERATEVFKREILGVN